MLIDIICLLLVVMAVFKGMSNGLIIALFSFASFIIGLAAATKLSAVVAEHLQSSIHVSGYWLPIISFIIVFAAVVLIVRWCASLLKKAVSIVFLGWVDSVAGIILYAVIYLMVFSVILFFATQIHLVTEQAKETSKTYAFVEPFGPKVLNGLGRVLPLFKGMFAGLQNFFHGVSTKAS